MRSTNFAPAAFLIASFAIFLFVGLGLTFFTVNPFATAVLFAILFLMAAITMSYRILGRRTHTDDTAARRIRAAIDRNGESQSGLKPKRGESLAELMDALDDDDLYDLRQHIKRRLMDQVDAGDDEYVETFEELLADVEDKRKRG